MIQYLYYGKITNSSFYISFLNLVKRGVFKLEERANKVGKTVQTIIYKEGEQVQLTEPEKEVKKAIKDFLVKDEVSGEQSIDMLTLSKKMKNSTGSRFRMYKIKMETAKDSLFGEPTKAPKTILVAAVLAIIALIGIISLTAFQVRGNSAGDEAFVIPIFLGFITFVYSIIFASAGTQLGLWIFLIFHCGCFQGGIIAMMVSAGVGWLYIPYILCFALIQYLIRVKKYSREEREVIAKIKGLRRYIKDYSLMRERDGLVENIALWEDYFILAIALGLNTKTINYFYHYGKEQVSSNLGMSMHYTAIIKHIHLSIIIKEVILLVQEALLVVEAVSLVLAEDFLVEVPLAAEAAGGGGGGRF